MNILVLGSNGQLGRCLADQFSGTDYETIFTSRADLDVADLSGSKDKITKLCPDLIINASAYTAVDKAEQDRDMAYLINHEAVANIAQICAELGCGLIHVSTDYVFDGAATQPYRETDATNPQGVYGDSKLKGELAIQASGCQHLIIRTAWVFSEYGNNFLKTMLRLGSERDELSIVGDQIGCPTYAQDIAKTIVALVAPMQEQEFCSGTFHYCGDKACSWYEFAKAIFATAAEGGFTVPERVNAISSKEYPTPAARPAYSVLDCTSLAKTFEIAPSDWQRAIPMVLSALA
jgi:dTDP-4-dehydrorhamnose reductase